MAVVSQDCSHCVSHRACHKLYRYSGPEDISACWTITQDISAQISCRIAASIVVSGCVATASTESYRYVSKAVRYQARLSVSVRIQERTLNAICKIIQHIEHIGHRPALNTLIFSR